jgi:hypothetical protein
MSLNSCGTDPTHFSATRHYYQVMLECLLSAEGTGSFPGIDENQLRNFRDTYGASAFVCRYLHCSKSTDGFDSLRQRDAHEASHQRKYRCAHLSCAYFHTGFATRNALNKHNDKYHDTVSERGTLAQAIVAQQQRKEVDTQPSNNKENMSHRVPHLPKQALDRETFNPTDRGM